MIGSLFQWFSQKLKGVKLQATHTAKCGHETKIKDTVTAFGETITTEIHIPENETYPEYCHRCIEKMAIKCAWCGSPIFIGDLVTLYTPKNNGFQIPEGAKKYSDNPTRLVGCLKWECAETGADRAGFWMPPGKVERIPSPLEIVMQSEGAVIYNDLTDPNEKPTICNKD